MLIKMTKKTLPILKKLTKVMLLVVLSLGIAAFTFTEEDIDEELALPLEKAYSAEQRGDYTTAFKEYLFHAKQGNPYAHFFLSEMYFSGKGVLQDYTKSYMWMNLSATAGFEPAREGRDIFTDHLTRTQIAQGQELARECLASNYKNC
jgi:TPR repeat protein